MATFNATAVDDRTDDHFYLAEVRVDDGDDLILLLTEDHDYSMETRMTIGEALIMIASLSEAVAAAVENRNG